MEPFSPSDAELVARTRAGDHEAFGLLYDRYAGMVRAVVVGISGDWSAAEDMSQESFLRAYKKLETLRKDQSAGPWIAGIARYVARERRRGMRRDRHKFRPNAGDQAALYADETGASEASEQTERVMCGVAQLPELERLAIHLHFFDERNAEQSAEVLGLSRSGFYGLLQRAIARLAVKQQPGCPAAKEGMRQ
jgi:RNA polymerase sigma-70 factor (ECF subfamily)